MKLLGIDYGSKKIGLAVSDGLIARPLGVIRGKSWQKEIQNLCQLEKIDKIIIGISEGQTADKTLEFVNLLHTLVLVPTETWDETGTTQEATKGMISTGKKRSRRKKIEDAIAAALILQSYIDSRG